MGRASTPRYGTTKSSSSTDPAVSDSDVLDGSLVTEDAPTFNMATYEEDKTSKAIIDRVEDEQDPDGPTDYLFPYLIITQIFMYLEAGAVPSLLEQFTRTFHMDPEEQGLLGAIVYISISCASPWCSTLFKRYCPRTLLGVTLALNNVALLCFAFAPTIRWFSKSLLVFLRAIVGATQAFHCVYSVLWVHEFAPKAKRGQWMSYLQAAVPLGITFGYLAGSIALWAAPNADEPSPHLPLFITANGTKVAASAMASIVSPNAVNLNLLNDVGTKDTSMCGGMFCWRWPFMMQFLLVLPFSMMLFFVPREHIVIPVNEHVEGEDELSNGSAGEEAAKTFDVGALNPAPIDERTRLVASPVSTIAAPDMTPRTERRRRVRKAERGWDNLVELFSHRVFVAVVLALSALFFVVTGVQFWGTMYFSTNTADSVYEIHVAYLLVSGTGPILGVFFGGWLIDHFGGYAGTQQQAKALRICAMLGLLACLSSLPVSFVHTTVPIAISLWFMLFFGGSILPSCSGIVVSSAPRRLRPLASSVAYTSYNMLGYAASNYVPGYIMNWIVHSDNGTKPWCDAACTYRIGFRIVLFWGFAAVLCLASAAMCAQNEVKKELERQQQDRQMCDVFAIDVKNTVNEFA